MTQTLSGFKVLPRPHHSKIGADTADDMLTARGSGGRGGHRYTSDRDWSCSKQNSDYYRTRAYYTLRASERRSLCLQSHCCGVVALLMLASFVQRNGGTRLLLSLHYTGQLQAQRL